MHANEAYEWLMGVSAAVPHDAFDVHIVASILALGVAEASSGERSIADGVGLDRDELVALLSGMFPGALAALDSHAGGLLEVDDEEQSLRDILGMYSAGTSQLERALVAMIARRCKWPHHLWQDLGLRNRRELSELMGRHFPMLAAKNKQDMKWKKFLYRMVCGSEGFVLCTAPVCSECDDFNNCFGAEDGESRLAVARNAPMVTI
jgi:nitrogen fixation protein NifQ